MKSKNVPLFETLLVFIGELAVALITAAVYLLLDKFSYKVITGGALGVLVTTLNFLFLAITTNRAFDKAVEARGTREMTEEEVDAFAKEHQRELNNSVKISFLVRTFTMLATLIAAFLLDYFAIFATLIPLLMMKPIIIIETVIREKFKKG